MCEPLTCPSPFDHSLCVFHIVGLRVATTTQTAWDMCVRVLGWTVSACM